LQDKRASTADALTHPWLAIPLTSEQQESWTRLQEDQAILDRQLQAASNPRLVRVLAQLILHNKQQRGGIKVGKEAV
jgi:hypothetical protein